MHNLEFLEIMVNNACNLSCEGCTTFSDLTHQGYITWNEGNAWLEPWSYRVNIQAVGVMGGEPLMNPEIREWILGIRKMLPNAQIRFVTNGLLLDKHWDVVDLLESVGNAVLKISYHVQNEKLDQVIDRVMKYKSWQSINEYGIDRFVAPSGLRFQIARPTRFIKTFKNDYHNMMPHNNAPQEAFELCVQKKCPMLYNGRLWKCGTLALTPYILERMNRPNYHHWLPYIDPGLQANCTESDLSTFIDNFGKPHKLCRQCPSASDYELFIDHTSTVTFKGKPSTK